MAPPISEVQPPTTLVVSDDAQGKRLDRWLTSVLTDRSRSEIQRWIKDGLVTLDGLTAKARLRVEAGQVIVIQVPEVVPHETLRPSDIPLDLCYEDDDLLIIDKPAGMVVHPAPGHPDATLVNAVLFHCPEIEGVGGERRPGLVHRLDKDTSGLIVVAKNDRSHRHLQAQFKDRSVYKEYVALVEGRLDPESGRISAPLGRHPVDRKRQAVLPSDPVTGVSRGREAVTDYYTLATYATKVRSSQAYATFTLARAVLQTGRTHQIRVHFAWCKHPVVGDTVYGFSKQRLPINRQFLHAHKLRLRLPGNNEEREFVAPLPADLEAVLNSLEQ